MLVYLLLAKLLGETDAKNCRKEKINHRGHWGHGGKLRTRWFTPEALLLVGGHAVISPTGVCALQKNGGLGPTCLKIPTLRKERVGWGTRLRMKPSRTHEKSV